MSNPSPNIGAQRAAAYMQMRRDGAAARRRHQNSASEIARRAAAHREQAEGHMEWVRAASDPRLAAFAGDPAAHQAEAIRHYTLAHEEEA
jgi:hypothetical protein